MTATLLQDECPDLKSWLESGDKLAAYGTCVFFLKKPQVEIEAMFPTAWLMGNPIPLGDVIWITCGIGLAGEDPEYVEPDGIREYVALVAVQSVTALDHWSVRWEQVWLMGMEWEELFREVYVRTQQGINRMEVRE